MTVFKLKNLHQPLQAKDRPQLDVAVFINHFLLIEHLYCLYFTSIYTYTYIPVMYILLQILFFIFQITFLELIAIEMSMKLEAIINNIQSGFLYVFAKLFYKRIILLFILLKKPFYQILVFNARSMTVLVYNMK